MVSKMEGHQHLRDASGDARPIQVGELYEDCSYEPMLCLLADYDSDELTGVSLVNGRVGSCSPTHCGVRKLSLREALEIRGTWPPAHLVEWARANGVALRMQGDTVQPDRLRPGQVGLMAEQLQHMLERLE